MNELNNFTIRTYRKHAQNELLILYSYTKIVILRYRKGVNKS